jgi:glycine hydroxymethyltransferase
MQDVAKFYARVLLKEEDPKRVRDDVRELKEQHQTIRYCFNEEGLSGYPE